MHQLRREVKKMNKFYEWKQSDDGTHELYIFGDITSYKWYESDVNAFDMAKELSEIEGDLNVRINSYGGEVSNGLAIYNLLKSYGGKHKVTTYCDGFACSAASVIFMAGQERIMPKSSLLLIHNAWTYASGDFNELRKQADDLEKITKPSLEIYKAVSNLSEKEIQQMMDKEEWITADEALSYGFATSINEDAEAKQSLSQQMLQRMILRSKRLEQENRNLKEQQEIVRDPWKQYFKGGH